MFICLFYFIFSRCVCVHMWSTHFARSFSWQVSQTTQSVRPTYLISYLMQWLRMMWFLYRARLHNMEWHLDGIGVLPSFHVQIGATTLYTFRNTPHCFKYNWNNLEHVFLMWIGHQHVDVIQSHHINATFSRTSDTLHYVFVMSHLKLDVPNSCALVVNKYWIKMHHMRFEVP